MDTHRPYRVTDDAVKVDAGDGAILGGIVFDADYYAHGCGALPYRRDETWLRHFGAIADRIVGDFHPFTALDAGCAMGLLVEALRNRGVRAWGIDISPYAISQVHPNVREFCTIGSVTDPLPRRYDLIVCIEVLEHVPQPDAELAIANFCQHADSVLFSSSPDDVVEPTHINLHSPEYWAEQFARHDFYRDVWFDGSFIAPWAMSFRRLRQPRHHIVSDYERRLSQLQEENRNLRDLVTRFEQGRFIRTMRWLNDMQRRLSNRAPTPSVTPVASDYRRQRAASRHVTAEPADYRAWIAAHEPTEDELEGQKQTARAFSYRPLISLITPVYNPPPHVLRQAIESVLAQTYSNWELCLVDGGSNQPEIRAMLSDYARKDNRIRAKRLERNLGISGNSNAALRMATGEFVLLFDHDDLLAPFALYEVVRRLNETPELDIVYYDEDKISADGAVRLWPWLKPGRWSPELMLSANTLMHSVIRRTLVEAAGSFDPSTDGAQDWDLLLRCTEKTDRIAHIPRILYHWRMLLTSAATTLEAKPWAIELQPQVVARHLRRMGLPDVSTKLYSPGHFQLVWPPADEKVSIIVPTTDNLPLLRRCLESLFALTAYKNYEVILVDTASANPDVFDYYDELSSKQPRGCVRIVRRGAPFNYSTANNLGVQQATGAHLLFLNNDVEILEAGWLEEMLRWSQRREVGAVGAKLLYPEGTIQHAGVIIGVGHIFAGVTEDYIQTLYGGPNWYRNYSAVTGACMMVRRDAFEAIGGFDERYTLAFGDVELCARIAAKGYRIVYTPFARLRHHEGATRANYVPTHDDEVASQSLRELIERGDPYYNPNLARHSRVPRLAITPTPAEQLSAFDLPG
jgi:GT2 family glycosyltransferase